MPDGGATLTVAASAFALAARSRTALTAIAAVSPPMVSDAGNPTRRGPVVASPVTLIAPERPCTIWS